MRLISMDSFKDVKKYLDERDKGLIENPDKWIPNVQHFYEYIQAAECDENGIHIVTDNGEQENIFTKTQYYLYFIEDQIIEVYKRESFSDELHKICDIMFPSSLSYEGISGIRIVMNSYGGGLKKELAESKDTKLRDILEYFLNKMIDDNRGDKDSRYVDFVNFLWFMISVIDHEIN